MPENNSDYAIGVFDSGCGGLTTVKAINEIMPNEDVIFFGDTARVPYGSKSRETLNEYAIQDANFLRRQNVKMLIAACGTISSIIGFGSLCDDMPFTGVVIPASIKAVNTTKNKKIAVLGTQATIRSKSFENAIKFQMPDAKVTSVACPMFVPLVENGFINKDNEITRLVAKQYLDPIKDEGFDTCILGCTHFPIIKDVIQDILGDGVTLLSSGEEAARYAKKVLESNNLLNSENKKGKNTFFVSDSIELFSETAGIFLGSDIRGDVFKAIVP